MRRIIIEDLDQPAHSCNRIRGFPFCINNLYITIHRYPIFSTRYSVTCKVHTGCHKTREIEHGLCACTVDNPLAKARGLSLRTGAQTMLYLSHGLCEILSSPKLNPCHLLVSRTLASQCPLYIKEHSLNTIPIFYLHFYFSFHKLLISQSKFSGFDFEISRVDCIIIV